MLAQFANDDGKQTVFGSVARRQISTGTRLSDTVERIRWRLWHRQVARGLEFIAETMATPDVIVGTTLPADAVALKIGCLLGELETYICGQSDIISD
jgi:hypothetical protein